jgi:uncharacterized membrane protein
MYATSFVAHSPISYFNFNALLLALLFIFVIFIVRKIQPEFTYLVPVAPAMIASLYINWDLWAIATMMLAIYWFDRKAYLYSSIALAVSISTKFLPVFLLLPIIFILWRSNQWLNTLQPPLVCGWQLIFPLHSQLPQGGGVSINLIYRAKPTGVRCGWPLVN